MELKDVLKAIGARMKELRLAQNMKQTVMVERTGLSLFTISQTETGHNTSLETIILMLNALNRMDVLDSFLKGPEGNASNDGHRQKAVRRRLGKSKLSKGCADETLRKVRPSEKKSM